MLLDATTDALEVILDKAITTNQLSFSVFYNEYDATSVTPMSNYGTTNSTTAVNLIASPTAGKQRQLRWCSINNVDTVDVGVKIRFNANSNYRNVLYVFLRVGESIQYSEEMGWRVYTANGEEKTSGYNKLPASVRYPETFGAGNTTTTQTLATGTSYCIYLGRAERPFSSIKLQYRITTQAAAISWAELAIYKGTPTLQSNTALTRLGYTDVSGVWNSTGTKTTTVNISNICIGEDLWAVFANSATTVAQVAAGLVDHLGAGYTQTIASTQPSAVASFTPTISTAVNMPWIAWQGVYQGT